MDTGVFYIGVAFTQSETLIFVTLDVLRPFFSRFRMSLTPLYPFRPLYACRSALLNATPLHFL